jgi:hypothetical protein
MLIQPCRCDSVSAAVMACCSIQNWFQSFSPQAVPWPEGAPSGRGAGPLHPPPLPFSLGGKLFFSWGACLDAGSATGSGTVAFMGGGGADLLPVCPGSFGAPDFSTPQAYLVAGTGGDSAPSAPVNCFSAYFVLYLPGLNALLS